jgi:NADH-quinone oxidoreductase subunit C
MSDEEIVRKISEFPNSEVKVLREGEIAVKVPADKGHEAAKFLKDMGFTHLVSIEYVDWIKDDQFELVYNLFSYSVKKRVFLKVRIPRDNPEYVTFMDLWPVAMTHEREAHEMMGIKFKGNPNLTPFILEDWKWIPPLRKDFDSRKFVKEQYDSIPFVEEGEK